jgi:hypothetical protein
MMIDSIFLYPLEGTFDVEAVERFLAQQPDVLLDPVGTGTYLVCGSPESIEHMREWRLSKPREFPYCALVTIKPDRITVAQEFANETRLRSARDIVRWLLEQTQSRIEDEYGNDWTERVARDGVDVLYPEQLV